MSGLSMSATPANARAYALAGHATITLSSTVSGREFTYQIARWRGRGLVVRLLNGDDAQYLGILDEQGFRLTAASGFGSDCSAVRAFAFFWRIASSGAAAWPEGLTVSQEKPGDIPLLERRYA